MKQFVRITGGYLKKRKIETPGVETHPSGSRMREGIFNMLGDLDGLSITDLYSGSGILAFEAISRGAQSAIVVDISPTALNSIRKSTENLEITDKIDIVQADVDSYLTNHMAEEKIESNIIFIDPPYPQFSWSIVAKLGKTLAKRNTLMVVSHPGVRHTEHELDGLVVVKEKTYGDAHVTILKQK